MFVCVTSHKEMSDEQKEKIGEQGQLMRANGFLRLTSIPMKKAIERMMSESHVHEALTINSIAQKDRYYNLADARYGKFDDVEVQKETLIQGPSIVQ